MNLQHLNYIVALYRSESMVEAAERCYVTQPTISKAVRALEQEFSIELLQRNRSSEIQFTPDGELFIEKAQRILNDYEILSGMFSAKNAKHLNVASQHFVFVAEAFIEMTQCCRNCDFQLQFKEMQTKAVVDEVYTGKSSLGFIFLCKRNSNFLTKYLRERDIEFTELGAFPFRAFTSTDHPLAEKKSVCLRELEDYPYVCYAQSDYSLNFMEEGIIPRSEQIIRVCDRDTMYRVMQATHAYTIGTGTLRSDTESEAILSIPISDIQDHMRIGWIRRSGFNPSAIEKQFLQICTDKVNLFRMRVREQAMENDTKQNL